MELLTVFNEKDVIYDKERMFLYKLWEPGDDDNRKICGFDPSNIIGIKQYLHYWPKESASEYPIRDDTGTIINAPLPRRAWNVAYRYCIITLHDGTEFTVEHSLINVVRIMMRVMSCDMLNNWLGVTDIDPFKDAIYDVQLTLRHQGALFEDKLSQRGNLILLSKDFSKKFQR
ncbi:MAG: hypothetical protein FWE67_08790 [Planctomycetaceae bacterium]|nr:hypothetical protein [Planctomycetaceae bacterium]